MGRFLAVVVLLVPLSVLSQQVVTSRGGLTATSPFTVTATGESSQSISHSYVYLDGILVHHATGRTITATISASPGSHRVSFTFKQASGEVIRSTMYVNVLAESSSTRSVRLDWRASTSSGVSGYRVYRGTSTGGPYARITGSTLPALTYVDPNVVSGRNYYYVVTAVTSGGRESSYSNEARANIP
jgi:hypothetical protein